MSVHVRLLAIAATHIMSFRLLAQFEIFVSKTGVLGIDVEWISEDTWKLFFNGLVESFTNRAKAQLIYDNISGGKCSLIGWQKGNEKGKGGSMWLKKAEQMSMLSTIVLYYTCSIWVVKDWLWSWCFGINYKLWSSQLHCQRRKHGRLITEVNSSLLFQKRDLSMVSFKFCLLPCNAIIYQFWEVSTRETKRYRLSNVSNWTITKKSRSVFILSRPHTFVLYDNGNLCVLTYL